MDAVVERLRAARQGECQLLLHQINLGGDRVSRVAV
jgi:hypothetical protein